MSLATVWGVDNNFAVGDREYGYYLCQVSFLDALVEVFDNGELLEALAEEITKAVISAVDAHERRVEEVEG